MINFDKKFTHYFGCGMRTDNLKIDEEVTILFDNKKISFCDIYCLQKYLEEVIKQ